MARGRKPQPIPDDLISQIIADLRSLKQMNDIARDRGVSLYYIRKIKIALISGAIPS